jgi:hypothetical protein
MKNTAYTTKISEYLQTTNLFYAYFRFRKFPIVSYESISEPDIVVQLLAFKFADGGLDYNDEEDLMEYYKIGEGKLHFVPEVELTDKNKIRIVSLCPRLKPSKIYDTAADIDGIKDCKNIHGKNCSDWAELTPSNKNLSKKQLCFTVYGLILFPVLQEIFL